MRLFHPFQPSKMRLTAALLIFASTILSFQGATVNAQLGLRAQTPNIESESDNSETNTGLSKLRRHPGNGDGNGNGTGDGTGTTTLTTVQQKRDQKLQNRNNKPPKKNPKKNKGNTLDPRSDVPTTDHLCTRFCNDYFEKCSANNVFLQDFDSQESDLKRMTDSKPLYPNYFDECGRVCMLWPRPVDPASFATQRNQGADPVNSATGGDTFWCRQDHLARVESKDDAAFHCPHASNKGMGICRDALVNGYTPYEWLRAGAGDVEKLLDCKLYGEKSEIAQCEDSGVTDENLPLILQSLPDTTQIIFLSGNVGINSIPANIFRDNLQDPLTLEALYLNDCELQSIDEHALNGLTNLKIFDAAVNFLPSLPEKLLKPTPNLLQFQMFQNRLTEIPPTFFSHTPNLERIAMYGNSAITGFSPSTFNGLTQLQLLSFAACRIYSFNIPTTLFQDLRKLLFLDLFDNRLTEFKANWFEGGWDRNLLRLAFQNNGEMSVVGNGAFDGMNKLEVVYFHGTRVSERAEEFFDGTKPYFQRITVP